MAKMAKIKKIDLESLSNEDIRRFYIAENIDAYLHTLSNGKVRKYLQDGIDVGMVSPKINRIESILNRIVIDRFIKNEL